MIRVQRCVYLNLNIKASTIGIPGASRAASVLIGTSIRSALMQSFVRCARDRERRRILFTRVIGSKEFRALVRFFDSSKEGKLEFYEISMQVLRSHKCAFDELLMLLIELVHLFLWPQKSGCFAQRIFGSA